MSDAPLKLLAFDQEDLAILSAHMQDAVLKVGDVAYLPKERRFAFAANRFDWETSVEGKANRRRATAVHFEGVRGVKSRGLSLDKKDEPLVLLAIAFEETDAPAGAVLLHFSGGACIRLDVECLEAALKDLGPSWETARCPVHPIEEV